MEEQYAFSRTPAFRTFARALAQIEGAGTLVHGVVIDLHPIWRKLEAVHTRTGVDLDVYESPHLWHLLIGAQDVDRAFPVLNIKWESAVWKAFCYSAGKKRIEPFIVKVCIAQPQPADNYAYQKLIELIAQQPFFATVEVRQAMRAAALPVEGGRSIAATGRGTIGGFLKDQGGSYFGLTCAHVAQDTNVPFVLPDIGGSLYTNAGIVQYTNYRAIVPQTFGQMCNPDDEDVGRHQVDAALFEMSTNFQATEFVFNIGAITEIYYRRNMQSGMTVYLRGALSGRGQYAIGGYCVMYRVLFPDGQFRCFSNLYEIVGQSKVQVPARIATALAPRAQTGDSGAWVCCENSTQNFSASGTLIAVDEAVGIATFMDPLLAWTKSHGLDLDVF